MQSSPSLKFIYVSVKTCLIVSLLGVLPSLLFAQHNSSLDIAVGTDYTYRNLRINEEMRNSAFMLRYRDSTEVGQIGWRIGIHYNRRIWKRFFLRGGVQISQTRYRTKELSMIWRTGLNGSLDIFYTIRPVNTLQLTYTFYFVQLPIVGRIEWGSGKWTPFAEIGIIPSFNPTYTRKTITTEAAGTYTFVPYGSFFADNSFQWAGLVSLGFNYALNDRLQFFAQPAFRYHTTPVLEGEFSEYLYTVGVETGLRRKW